MLTCRPDRALRVPEEEAAQSGLATDQVKINPKYGGGYPANVEGLHHLHCLVSRYMMTDKCRLTRDRTC
jgi:hypothetical protein